MPDRKMRILIVSPSQGHYGGMEAFVLALASSIETWPEFQLRVCFKLVGKRELKQDLRQAAAVLSSPVHYLPSGDFGLVKLIRWADLVHGQNTSPDIVFPARLLAKKLVLTI